jgi:hypothetical protein
MAILSSFNNAQRPFTGGSQKEIDADEGLHYIEILTTIWEVCEEMLIREKIRGHLKEMLAHTRGSEDIRAEQTYSKNTVSS